MIHSLEFALEMHKRCRTTEMLVSESVFQEVLSRVKQDHRWAHALLNCHYDSPHFRFIHQAEWGGVRFIHLSNEELDEDLCPASAPGNGS